jgi:hypothetical protein
VVEKNMARSVLRTALIALGTSAFATTVLAASGVTPLMSPPLENCVAPQFLNLPNGVIASRNMGVADSPGKI